MSGNWRRTGLAIVLAVLFPGLGHAYLRRWVRALLWAGAFLVVAGLTVPAVPTEGGVLESTRTLLDAMSPAATLALSGVQLVNAIDAGLLATRAEDAGDSEGARCPNCRKELDEDLDFCPWCTTRLKEGRSADQ